MKCFRKREVTIPHNGVHVDASALKLVGKRVWYKQSAEEWVEAKVHSVRSDGSMALELCDFASLSRQCQSRRKSIVHARPSMVKEHRTMKHWVSRCCAGSAEELRRWANQHASGEKCMRCGAAFAKVHATYEYH